MNRIVLYVSLIGLLAMLVLTSGCASTGVWEQQAPKRVGDKPSPSKASQATDKALAAGEKIPTYGAAVGMLRKALDLGAVNPVQGWEYVIEYWLVNDDGTRVKLDGNRIRFREAYVQEAGVGMAPRRDIVGTDLTPPAAGTDRPMPQDPVAVRDAQYRALLEEATKLFDAADAAAGGVQ